MLPLPRFSPRPKTVFLPMVVGFAVSLAAASWLQTAPSAPPPAGKLFAPVDPQPVLPAGSGLEAEIGARSSSVSAANAPRQPEDTVTLDEFLGLLAERVPEPVARQVKREFMQQPRLKQAWNVYQRKAGGKAPAKEFLAFVSRIPEFRQLVAKFRADPGTQAAFGAIGKSPELSKVLRDGLRALPAGGAAAGAGAKSAGNASIAREWARKAISGVDPRVKLTGGVPSKERPAGAAGAPSAAAGGAGAAGAANGAAGSDAAGGSQAAPPSLQGSAVKNATKFDTSWKGKSVKDTANFADSRKWLTKFLLALSPSTRAKVQPLLESGREDVWGACYIAGSYDECRQVCAQVPEAQCEDKDRWEACRSGGTRDPKACVLSCIGSDAKLACAPHRDEWDPLCAAKAVGRSYCLTAQDYGPLVCASGAGTSACGQEHGSLDGVSEATISLGGSSANTCGSEVEMSQAPCPQLEALLAQVQAAAAAAAAAEQAAAAATAAAATASGACSPPMQGPCPGGGVVDSCTGGCSAASMALLHPGGGSSPWGAGGNVCVAPHQNSLWEDIVQGAASGAGSGAVTGLFVGGVPGAVIGTVTGAVGGAIGGAWHHIFG